MLIAWSGGIDSTVVLYHALQWWYNRRTEGVASNWEIPINYHTSHHCSQEDQKPRTFSIECNQFPKKQQEKQLVARNKLIQFFNNKGWHFNHATIHLESFTNFQMSGSFPQPLMWLTQAALYISDKEPLLLGWIRGDDAMAYQETFQKLWESATKVNGKRCPLLLPLHQEHKWEVIQEAEKQGVLHKCWYCEFPTDKGKPCRHCMSCDAMTGAQAIIKQKQKLKTPHSLPRSTLSSTSDLAKEEPLSENDLVKVNAILKSEFGPARN